MIRMVTCAVREVRRVLAVATPERDPILDPAAGVVHGEGQTPTEYLPTRTTTITTRPGPAEPILQAPRTRTRRQRRRRRHTRAQPRPLRGLFGPRSLR